jgi:hypothetical protein
MPRYYSDHESPDDLIDKYTSPSVCPESSTGSLEHGKTGEMIHRSLSARPLYSPTVRHHRKSSTNSGYLSRAELFGRSTPEPASSILPPSHGLERTENRSDRCATAPDDVNPSSLIMSFQHDVRDLPTPQSTQSLHVEHEGAYSFPDQRASHTSNRFLPTNSRDGCSGSTQDTESGGHSPGPVQTSGMSFRYPRLSGSERKLRTSSVCEFNIGAEEVSLAQSALRHSLSKATPLPRPLKVRSSS